MLDDDAFKQLQQNAEGLLEELERIVGKQEEQLKEIALHRKNQLPEAVQQTSDALIQESEMLLKKLSTALEQQRITLAEAGIDLNQKITTGNEVHDQLLKEQAEEFAVDMHREVKERVKQEIRRHKMSGITPKIVSK